jgi:hypothetical protein
MVHSNIWSRLCLQGSAAVLIPGYRLPPADTEDATEGRLHALPFASRPPQMGPSSSDAVAEGPALPSGP